MSVTPEGAQLSFSELVFSDLQRYRPGERGWLRVIVRCLTLPGLVASIILRAQQSVSQAGHERLANVLRMLGVVLLGADFGPGMSVGPGLMIAHPVGVSIGYGLTIGSNVTLAGGVVTAARYPDVPDQKLATIADDAVIGAHAVLVGEVRVGRNAMVGSNTVVLSDVPDDAVVFGVPARQIGTREAPAQ